MTNLKKLIRENVQNLKPYNTARDEFKGKAEVYLDANENPFRPPNNRYPDPLQTDLKERIAKLKGISAEHIFLGNGSDEAIDLLIRAFCEPHKESIIVTEPTYGMYSVCAGTNAVQVKDIPLDDQFGLDDDRVLQAVDETTKIIFFASPNNPTGNALDQNRVLNVVRSFAGIVVVDEAYIDFSSQETLLRKIETYPNLVVLQTFSKAWGLAAVRLGMCFADPEVIGILNKIKHPYNINGLTLATVTAALENSSQVQQSVELLLRERASLEQSLTALACVKKVYASDSNFLLVKMDDGHKAYRFLLEEGIIVRDRSQTSRCEDCLRITVGTDKENALLIKALKKYEKSANP